MGSSAQALGPVARVPVCYPWPMKSAFLLVSAASLLGLAACGSSVETVDGSGGATTTTTPTGTGTTTSTSTSTTTTTWTSSGGGSGGGAPCAGEIQLVVDNGSPEILTSICYGAWGSNDSTKAVGYIFSGGPAPGTQGLVVLGCVGPETGSEGIQLAPEDAIGPGDYTAGSTTYTDPGGMTWGVAGDPFAMTVTNLQPVGGSIQGNFQVMVTHGGNAAHNLEGTFDVCHVTDMQVP
jgi:hypothetical protein